MEARRAHRGEPPFFTNNLGACYVFVQQRPPHAWVTLMKFAVSVFPDELYPPPRSWDADRFGATPYNHVQTIRCM
jgi:hypothetical protein